MTIRSGHHVAGSPRAGRGGGKIGHAITWLLFHMAKAIQHFSEASFNGGPGCWDWRQERTGSLDSRPDALRDVLAADRADLERFSGSIDGPFGLWSTLPPCCRSELRPRRCFRRGVAFSMSDRVGNR